MNWAQTYSNRVSAGTLVPRRRLLPALAAVVMLLHVATSPAQSAGAIGSAAPDFTLRSLTGPNVRLSDSRGDVVLLSFWTSWCGSCKAQLERVARLSSTYRPAGLVVIGVNLDDDREKARSFARANGGDVPQAFDTTKSVAKAYAINDVPLTILIDRNGVMRYVHGDFARRDEGDLVEQIRHLLDE